MNKQLESRNLCCKCGERRGRVQLAGCRFCKTCREEVAELARQRAGRHVVKRIEGPVFAS